MPCIFQLKLRQASEYPKWFGNIQCRAVGSAKLCKTAKGGEGVDIWGRRRQELRGHSLNMLELLGSEATRNIGFPKRNCCNHMEVKYTAQGLYAVYYLQGGHALDTTSPNISGCSSIYVYIVLYRFV